MENPISNDVFDTRDLIGYRDYLEEEILEKYVEWAEEHNEHTEGEEIDVPDYYEDAEFIDEESFVKTCEELINHHEEIVDFCNELSDYAADFEHGETVIHENYFTEYCKGLLEEVGGLPKDLPFYIEDNINWEGVAEDLEADYMRVEYEGNDYLIR